jgi:hypothetical protein
MKRNLFYVLCAATLLSLGACGESLSPVDGPETPTPSVPEVEGMVRVSIPVRVADPESDATRGGGAMEPLHFTTDLGNGLVMESTLTSTPRTRYTEPQQVADGVSMIIALLTTTNLNNPISYELVKVADGKVTFHIPEEGEYCVAAYSENAPTITANITALFRERNESGLDVPVTGTDYDTPYTPAEGNYFAFYTIFFETGTVDNNHELMFGVLGEQARRLSSVRTISKYPTPDQSRMITFQHIFAKLTWNLTVEGVTDESMLVGNLGAGFYPRYKEQVVSVTTTNAALDLIHAGSTAADRGISFANTYSWPGDGGSPTYTGSISFVAAEGKGTPVLCIDSLVFVSGQGIEPMKVTNKQLPISGPNFTEFKKGGNYTLTSRIPKASPNSWDPATTVPSGTLAASNIYFDGTKLTFDQTPNADGSSGQKQGLYFKWGSLIGISPDGATYGTSTPLFVPIDVTNALCPPVTATTDPFTQVSGYANWDDIKAFNAASTPSAATSTYEASESGTPNWYGDICAYITGGSWRLPTGTENTTTLKWTYNTAHTQWSQTGGGSWGSEQTYPIGLGVSNDQSLKWVSNKEGSGHIVSTSPIGAGSVATYGQALFPLNGKSEDGAGFAIMLYNNADNTERFGYVLPSSGYRDATGLLDQLGTNWYYPFSSSANSLRLTRTSFSVTGSVANIAMPVRCVKK